MTLEQVFYQLHNQSLQGGDVLDMLWVMKDSGDIQDFIWNQYTRDFQVTLNSGKVCSCHIDVDHSCSLLAEMD